MPKAKTQYVCQSCGHASIRWAGQCGGCREWNTLVEEAVPTAVKAPVMKGGRSLGGDGGGAASGSAPRMAGAYGSTRPQRLSEVTISERHRLATGLAEFDRVLGGGAMVGSLTLVAGDPGIGKSTLMTELGRGLDGNTLLYVTGEESAQQVKLRARRMGVDPDGLFLFPETNVEAILAAAYDLQPDFMVVDSIQTVYRPDLTSAPGSVAQVRESTAALLDVTKTLPTTTFLIGHVTKQGSIAGPRVLEHMVDTVLHFEGDRHHAYRILRAVKNRFGAANELGVFEMREEGLKEVGNPSALFLSERQFGSSGSSVVCALEGTRPLLVEVQALVASTSYGTPQRTTTGLRREAVAGAAGRVGEARGLAVLPERRVPERGRRRAPGGAGRRPGRRAGGRVELARRPAGFGDGRRGRGRAGRRDPGRRPSRRAPRRDQAARVRAGARAEGEHEGAAGTEGRRADPRPPARGGAGPRVLSLGARAASGGGVDATRKGPMFWGTSPKTHPADCYGPLPDAAMRWIVLTVLSAVSVSAQPTWTRVSGADLTTLLVLNDSTIVAGIRPDANIVRSTDAGQSFSGVVLPGPGAGSPEVYAFAALSEATGHSPRLFAAAKYGGYRSDDGGLTWQSRAPGFPWSRCGPYGPPNYWDVVTSDEGEVVFGGTAEDKTCRDNVHHSFVSRDRGETWSNAIAGAVLSLSLANSGYGDVEVVGRDVVFVQIDGKVYRQNLDTGVRTATQQIPVDRFSPLSMTKSGAGSSDGVLYAGFYGQNPSAVPIGVWRSEDAGLTWEPVNDGLPSLDVTAIHALENGRVLAGVRHLGVFVSDDRGATWSAATSGLGAQTIRAFATGPDAVWAASTDGLYRSESFAVAETPRPESASATLRAWPSPAAQSLTLTAEGLGTGAARVEAFDALGRRVAVLHDGLAPDALRLAVEVGAWPPGVYVVRAVSPAGSASARVVVAR